MHTFLSFRLHCPTLLKRIYFAEQSFQGAHSLECRFRFKAEIREKILRASYEEQKITVNRMSGPKIQCCLLFQQGLTYGPYTNGKLYIALHNWQ